VLLTCVLGIISSALLAAAVGLPWYRFTTQYIQTESSFPGGTSLLNSTVLAYRLDGISTSIEIPPATPTDTFTSWTTIGDGEVSRVFSVCRAFDIVALVMSALLALLSGLLVDRSCRAKIAYFTSRTFLRVSSVLLSFLIVAVTAVASLYFLALPRAFEQSVGNCSDGPCLHFSGGSDDQEGSKVWRVSLWGPDSGWFLVISALPMALLAALSLGTAGSPDSRREASALDTL